MKHLRTSQEYYNRHTTEFPALRMVCAVVLWLVTGLAMLIIHYLSK